MSIRKRYNEALQLYSEGNVEPALILSLVATAGASERYRKHVTGGSAKMRGDDSKYFREYLSSKGIDRLLMIQDRRVELSRILYSQLRCESIHEASVNQTVFVDKDFYVNVDGDQITFGRQLVPVLLENIRKDTLFRDEFRDLLSPYENLVRLKPHVIRRDIFREISTSYDISGPDLDLLELVVTGLRPERLLQLDRAEMDNEFHVHVYPNLSDMRLNRAFLTAMSGREAGVIDRNFQLTKRGFEIIQALSSNYQTIDPGAPFL